MKDLSRPYWCQWQTQKPCWRLFAVQQCTRNTLFHIHGKICKTDYCWHCLPCILRFSSYLKQKAACSVLCERQNEFLIYYTPRPKYVYIDNTKSPNNTNPMIMQTLFSLSVRSQNFVLTYLRSMQLLLR